MKKRVMLAVYATVAALAGAALGGDVGEEKKTGNRGPRADYFPNVTLKTQEGKEVHFYDDLMEGKVIVLNFMYTTCKGICPGMMANLLELQNLFGDELGKDVYMYTITLDPENDTPEALKEYSTKLGVRKEWTFLTGSKDDIETIRRKLGFVDPDPELDADRSEHSGMVLIGNERLDRWIACPALLKPEQLAKSVQGIRGLFKDTGKQAAR